MSTVLEERTLAPRHDRSLLPWVALLAGLASLYVPTYLDLARGLWRDDEYAHGPIVLAVFLWLVWRQRDTLSGLATAPAPWSGSALLAFGLAMYVAGRTFGLAVVEVASHLPVIAGGVLLARGHAALRQLAFPLFFLVFLVPLPGFVLDFVTVPLKAVVSSTVEVLLAALGYPVIREGVVLRIGSHEMLVADACSGLNSIYSLFALGMLYAHVVGRRSVARTALVLAGIVPIALAANVVRVLALVLVTYHLGEGAAQGFVHEFAGLMVFTIAFLLLIGHDALVRRMLGESSSRARPSEIGFAAAAAPRPARASRATGRRAAAGALVAALAMGGTAAAAPALKPQPDARAAPDLEAIIPQSFGDWRLEPDVAQVAPAPDVQANLERLYRQVVSRAYVNSAGERMMLMVAYGGDQSDALKAHRQEACYAAQGFEIRDLQHARLGVAGRSLPATRFHALRGERSEPVTYWFTMGDRVVLGRAERLRVQVENGLARRVPDGMLVRVSSLSGEAASAHAAQQQFIAAVIAALPAAHASRFVGAERS